MRVSFESKTKEHIKELVEKKRRLLLGDYEAGEDARSAEDDIDEINRVLKHLKGSV